MTQVWPGFGDAPVPGVVSMICKPEGVVMVFPAVCAAAVVGPHACDGVAVLGDLLGEEADLPPHLGELAEDFLAQGIQASAKPRDGLQHQFETYAKLLQQRSYPVNGFFRHWHLLPPLPRYLTAMPNRFQRIPRSDWLSAPHDQYMNMARPSIWSSFTNPQKRLS